MPRKQKKYYFIYRTTNQINDKFYIGMHSTDNLEDGYVGSGKRLGYSVRKYGLETHKFEILEFLPSREELKKREAEVVNEELLTNPLCMNLKFGGEGGWDHVSTKASRAKGGRASGSRNILVSRKSFDYSTHSKEMWKNERDKMLNTQKAAIKQAASKESVEKRRKTFSIINHQQGEANSQFGTCWICNDGEAKKVKKDELQSWLDIGWRKGRK